MQRPAHTSHWIMPFLRISLPTCRGRSFTGWAQWNETDGARKIGLYHRIATSGNAFNPEIQDSDFNRFRMKLHGELAFVLMLAGLSCFHTQGDTIYVWSQDATIYRFDPSGGGVLFATNSENLSGGPIGLALDNVGNLYAGFPGGSAIWRSSPSGAVSRVGTADSVAGIAFNFSGDLYCIANGFKQVRDPRLHQ